jgi:hypothetical protein
MGQIKIYSELKSGKVNFEGARVRNKEIGSLTVNAHPSLTDRIQIKSNRVFRRNSNTIYRVFFRRLDIARIQNKDGQNLVADLGMDRDAVIAYVLTQITKPIVTEYFEYNPITDRLEANKNIEVKKHGFYIGGKYKMASGNSNLYYEDLATRGNSYPVMGEVFDQSLAENQVAGAGTSTPKMRVFGDYQVIPLGGAPVDNTAIDYDGDNFFPFNISGVGITTRAGEAVLATQQLKYEIIIDGISVYIQYLDQGAIAVNEDITWYFDHPLDIEAGTTLRATVYKVSTVDNQEVIDGIFQVCEGDASPTRYQTTVLNRFFDDRDLELISPYVHYQAMDFGLDSTGSTILMRDLSLGADSFLQPHAVNTLEAIANGTTIQIKAKGGAKIIVESLPVSGASIDGSLVNSVLNLAVVELNAIFTNTAGFASDDTFVSGFTISGDDLTLTLNDGVSYTVDVTSLGVDTNKFVQSGVVNGSDIVLTMSDATEVTIDASNMISGSTLSATNDRWYISYGANANDEVIGTAIDTTIVGEVQLRLQGPYYFGQDLIRGSEFKFNMQAGNQLRLGIWDGAEVPTSYTDMSTASNWNTVFSYANGSGKFTDSTNVDISTYHVGGYSVIQNNAMSIKFLDDGHLELWDVTANVKVGKTTIALGVSTFKLQFGGFNNSIFPNGIISTQDWTIVHDFDNSEGGIVNGIEDHTVIKSNISIEIGEKIMFMLDEVGQGDYFGTNYTAASSGVSTAEEQLDNEFSYANNEALQFEFSGTGDWDVNTNATYYFDNGAGIVGYRKGGANTIQGMFSMRFNDNGKLTIYSEDNNEKVATAKIDPQVGSSVSLYFGVQGNRAYYSIPVISKQSINQGSQPDVNFVPTVADQTVTVTEGDVLNFQIISSGNIVNHFAEVDAPLWMDMNQTTGVLSGTAPAFQHSPGHDTFVVNCKAGNAIGGHVDFTVTVNVTEIAYTNSKSIAFNGASSLLQGNPTQVTALDRATNGDGNAWTISMWVKPSSTTSTQTLMVYGALDDYNNGAITLKQSGGTTLVLNYGTVYNNIILVAGNSFVANTWQHVMITFDGGTTGVDPNQSSAYYSRFNIYVDGVLKSNIGVASGSGFDGVMSGANTSDNIFRFGKANNVHNNYFDGIMNQMAIWNSDQTSNVATIYNSGATQDLSQLASAPAHYYEIETGVTTITDIAGSANLTGYNFIAANLVSDTP